MAGNYGLDGIKNWKGQPAHPIDDYCNHLTDKEDRESMIAMFNFFARGDSGAAKALSELMNMVSRERAREEGFNNSEDA